MHHTFTIGASEQGLYLSSLFFFSFNVPPLLIPWDTITQVSPYSDSYWGESYQLDIGTPTITTLMLPRAALQAAETILTAKGR